MNATTFRKEMFKCLDDIKFGRPLTITNKSDNFVLMSEKDYLSLQETLYLFQDPVTRQSLLTDSKDEEWFDEKDLAWNSGL